MLFRSPARGASPELLAHVRDGAAEAGRDPSDIEITASMPDDPAELAALAARGVRRVLVPVTGVAGLKRIIRGPEDVLAWRDLIEAHASL